jgi:hypothetical protein
MGTCLDKRILEFDEPFDRKLCEQRLMIWKVTIGRRMADARASGDRP